MTKQRQRLYNLWEKALSCQAMLGLTKWSDFSEAVERGEPKKAQSFDGRIRCNGSGNNSQDFPKCNYAVKFYNTMTVSKQALHQIQGFRHEDKNDRCEGRTHATRTVRSYRGHKIPTGRD